MEQEFNTYNQQSFRPMQANPKNGFETSSMILGICALVSCSCFYGAIPLGALSILFALFSRGGQMKMSPKAKLGLFLGIAAILLTIAVTIGALYITLEEYGSFENILREYCTMYGLDFETEFGALFQ